jgi:hypothetical protein
MKMKRVFFNERAELIMRNKRCPGQAFTGELVSGLPGPLRKYLEICGYMNNPVPFNADVYWSESFLKMSPAKGWNRLETRQFNSVAPIARIAYMRFLNMPVAGRDLYLDGYGEMNGKLLGIIKVIFDNNREIAQSALLITFCEFLLVPGYLLTENVHWESIDEKTVRGTLTDGGIRVTATFRFNAEGMMTRVDTDDRYYSEGRNEYKKVSFSAVAENYKKQGEILIPERMKAVWHFPEGDYEYFRGTVDRIIYNVDL